MTTCFPKSLYAGIDLRISPDYQHHQVLEVNAFGDLLPSEGPAPEDVVHISLREETLRRALGELPERERTVVVMTFYDEYTRTNLPKSLGLSEGNLRVIRHRAIRRLRHCMGSELTGGAA